MVLPALSEKDSGKFKLSCESNEGTGTSLTVSLRVNSESHHLSGTTLKLNTANTQRNV